MVSVQLTQRILWALFWGVLVGLSLHGLVSWQPTWQPVVQQWLIDGIFFVLGKWFVALLMLMVVPLVLVSLMKGVAQLGASHALGKLSGLTIALYLFTTSVAIGIGLILAHIVNVGHGLSLVAGDAASASEHTPSLVSLLVSLVPNNPIAAMAEGNMLQVIIVAVLCGLAVASLAKEPTAARLLLALDTMETLFIRVIGVIMQFAPVGVFALMVQSLSSQGWDAFAPLLWYVVVVILALAIHMLVVYAGLFLGLTGLSLQQLVRYLKEVWTVSFSTSSSAATLPVTLETVRRMGVSPQVSSFTIPLGATINMDGTAIMQGVATVFIANAYGISLVAYDYVMIMLTATLASVGTAAVPSAGLIMLTMVLVQVGLPVEGVALILGVDRILDMLRTSVNVTGDVVVTTIVAKQLNQLDTTIFNHMD